MDRKIELPKRADNHIRETSGNKVLESVIPSEWIIRYVSERDYGVDCYIELVDDQNRLTGEIAFVQMKSTYKIAWRVGDNGFRFYKVEKATTNYLNSFKIPTYLFLVDLSFKELFFLSVKEYVQEHYQEYNSPGMFYYEFYKDENIFAVDDFLKSFRRNNRYEQFRNELTCFISNLQHYIDFMCAHNNCDSFLQIEPEDMMFFEAMHRNISFLLNYCGAKNKLTSIDVLKRKGEQMFGDDYEQTLFEGVLTDLFDAFKNSVLEVVDKIIDIVTVKECHYWLFEKTYIYNYFNNLDKTKLFS